MSSTREFGSAGEADCASAYDDTINIGHGRMAFAWSLIVQAEGRGERIMQAQNWK